MHVYTASGNAYQRLEANANSTRSANLYWAKKSDGSTLRSYVGSTGDASKMEIVTSTNDDIHLYTNNDPTNKGIMLKADGKVGVAITSPGAQFSVSGPASLVNLGGGATGSAALYINSTSGHTGELFQLLKNGSEKMQMDNDGRLGIGTNNPGFYLHVVGGTRFAGSENATHGQVSVHGTSGGDAQIAFVTDANGRAIYVDNDDVNKMKFSTGYGKGVAGKEIVMDNNAQLGIGTTSPGAKLHIVKASVPAANTTDTDELVRFGVDGNAHGRIDLHTTSKQSTRRTTVFRTENNDNLGFGYNAYHMGTLDIGRVDQGYTWNGYNGCLLYTSPSPRDVEESRMPSSA